MNAKKMDKIAVGFLYVIAIIIVLILFSLLAFILWRGVPQISWEFLTTPSKSFQTGGGIAIQLYNSFYLLILTMLISTASLK